MTDAARDQFVSSYPMAMFTADNYWNPETSRWEVHPASEGPIIDENLPALAGTLQSPDLAYAQITGQYAGLANKENLLWSALQKKWMRAHATGTGNDFFERKAKAIQDLRSRTNKAQADGYLGAGVVDQILDALKDA
jgi:hypothetical protein